MGISNKLRHEEIYPQLSQIAPTVFAERVGRVWKENFLFYADAVSKKVEGEAVMRQYDQRVAANLVLDDLEKLLVQPE